MADKWSAMLGQLIAYGERFGTTDVSSRNPEFARLGRWVAAQRHKRRKGTLSRDRVSRLESAGMVWSPGDTAWDTMFVLLRKYAAREGHCNIPEHYPPDQRLASWAHNQRYRKRRGDLLPDRRKKLQSIGFLWSIYKDKKPGDARATPAPAARQDVAPLAASTRRRPEERLYRLRQGSYVQFNGEGRMPEALARYEKVNKEMPPYFPLPRGETVFDLGDQPGVSMTFAWPGFGALPAAVMAYVNENGCLPRHT